MNQTLFDPDTESTNDKVLVDFAEGPNDYRITSMAVTQKGNGVQGGFIHLATGKYHTHYFGLFEPEPTGRIAKGDMKALWEATKLSGSIGLDRLPNFIDKVVTIDAFQNTGKNGKVYSNIKSVKPYDGTAPASKFNQPEDPDDKIDMTEKPAPATKETPAPAAAAPGKKWKDRLKK